jgi:hypothetical protein
MIMTFAVPSESATAQAPSHCPGIVLEWLAVATTGG